VVPFGLQASRAARASPQALSLPGRLNSQPPLVCGERAHAVLAAHGPRHAREVAVVRDEPQLAASHRPPDVKRDPLVPPQASDVPRVWLGSLKCDLLPDERLKLNRGGGAP